MNVCIQNAVRQALAEIKRLETLDDNLTGQSPAFVMQTLNDCLRLALEAKPEEREETIKQLRSFLCVDKTPMGDYGSVK
jgi:hypothetical protein